MALADLSVSVAKGDLALTWGALPAITAGDVVIVSACQICNCNLLSGASIGGRNVELSGCEISEWPADATGSCFWVSECVGGTYKLVNCTLRSNGDGQTSSAFLYINPQGPGNGTNRPVETKMRDDLTVIIDGVTIVTPNAGSLAKAVRIQGQNANKKINVAFVGAGIIWKATQGLCFVMVTDDTLSTVPTDHIIVDNVTGPNGVEQLLRPDAGIANANVRMMPQMASATVSCSTGTDQAASASVAFRYKFPRLPQVLGVSHRSTDGLAKMAWGGKQVTSAVYALTANDARLVALTSDLANFTSTEDIRLSGLFGIQTV